MKLKLTFFTLTFSIASAYSQIWVDAAGTAIEDGTCTITGQCEERGTKLASSAISPIDLSSINPMSDDLYKVVSDLADYLDGPNKKAVASCSAIAGGNNSVVRAFTATSPNSAMRYPVGSHYLWQSEIQNFQDVYVMQDGSGNGQGIFYRGNPAPSFRLKTFAEMQDKINDYDYFFDQTPRLNDLNKRTLSLPTTVPVIELDARKGFMLRLRYSGNENDLIDSRLDTLENFLPPGGSATYLAKDGEGNDEVSIVMPNVVHGASVATPVSVVGFYYENSFGSNGDSLSHIGNQEMIMSGMIDPNGNTSANINMKNCSDSSRRVAEFCELSSQYNFYNNLPWSDSRLAPYIGVGQNGVGKDLQTYDRYLFWKTPGPWQQKFPFFDPSVSAVVMPTIFSTYPTMKNSITNSTQSGADVQFIGVGYKGGDNKNIKYGDLIIGGLKINQVEHVKVGGKYTNTILMQASPYLIRSGNNTEVYDPSTYLTIVGAHYFSSLTNTSGDRDRRMLSWADPDGSLPVPDFSPNSPITITYQCQLTKQ